MKIIFGYYDDQDFGLTEYPDIPYPDEKDFDTFEEYSSVIFDNRNNGRFSVS